MKAKGKSNSPFGNRSEAYYLWLALVTVLIFPTMFLFVYLSSEFIPAHSAETQIESLHISIDLTFYYTSGDNDSGRYLTVRRPIGRTKLKMTGYDWAHYPRTSAYVTQDSRLVILGMNNDDYLMSSTFENLNPQDAAESKHWIYLGAFSFAETNNKRSLQFITPDRLAECIPMGSQGPFQSSLARLSARRSSCPNYWNPESGVDRDSTSQSRQP